MSDDEKVYELRCPGKRERNGEEVVCNAKLCERRGGTYILKQRMLEVTMVLGSVVCRKCGRRQYFPPNPIEDPQPILKEIDNGRDSRKRRERD